MLPRQQGGTGLHAGHHAGREQDDSACIGGHQTFFLTWGAGRKPGDSLYRRKLVYLSVRVAPPGRAWTR